MPLTIQSCPHCGAPLAVTRFAATVVCAHCAATVRVDLASVSARKYHEAWLEWDTPAGNRASRDANGAAARVISIGGTHWIPQRLLAHGEISDVHLARRARWPSELVLLKVTRDPDDAPLQQQEWSVLHQLHERTATLKIDLGARVPVPIVSAPLDDGRLASAYRWAGGFTHTFEAVHDAYPDGVPPVAAIWVWRRILEIIGALRQAGLVHGAILPNHLLIENGEHGVRLVGFSCAGLPGAPLRAVCTAFEDLYLQSMVDSRMLNATADLTMSARCVAYLLGRHNGRLPDGVPSPLADLLIKVGDGADLNPDPWEIHGELGTMAKSLFGPPAFHPIPMR